MGTYATNPEPKGSGGGGGRVLLYVTSHMSEQHKMFLRYCWPTILARSPLLREADVAVYLNPTDAGDRKEAMDVLKDTFPDHDLTVYLRGTDDFSGVGDAEAAEVLYKQTGAHAALREAVRFGWFEGYDWIVRLNPDVLVRDDSFLRSNMLDPSVSALLINCSFRGVKVHTDFFMIRPEVLSEESFPEHLHKNNAELTFSRSLQPVIAGGSHLWIPNAFPWTSTCRAGYGHDFHESPIVHEHVLHPDVCSVPESDAGAANGAFDEPWPQFWNRVQDVGPREGKAMLDAWKFDEVSDPEGGVG